MKKRTTTKGNENAATAVECKNVALESEQFSPRGGLVNTVQMLGNGFANI